jgi:hypothetical protein
VQLSLQLESASEFTFALIFFDLWLTFNPILYGKVEFMTSASSQWHLHKLRDALMHSTIVTNKVNSI